MLLIFESQKGAIYVYNGTNTIRIRIGWFNDGGIPIKVVGFDKKVIDLVYSMDISTFVCSKCKYTILLKQ